jgi:DNA polymerase phi
VELNRNPSSQTAEVQTFVQSNPHLGFALILQLTGVNGSQQFDKLTKTNTIESILTSMDAEGVKEYINCLLQQVSTFEANEKYATFECCMLFS